MASKKGFIMYCDILCNIELLNMEQRGVLFTAILCDQSGEELPEMDTSVKIAFSFIKKGIDLNTTKYNAIVEKRREAGKKGGRPPKANESKQKQIKANESKDKTNKPDNREQISDNSNQLLDNSKQLLDIRDKHEEVSVIRHEYGEYKNVHLSDEELDRLKEEFSECIALKKIEGLSVYLKTHKNNYNADSHYVILRRWEVKDQKETPEPEKKDSDKLAELEARWEKNLDKEGGG